MESNESIALNEIAHQMKRVADALEYIAGAIEDGPLNPTYNPTGKK